MEEEEEYFYNNHYYYSYFPMGKTCTIIRRSIFTFLQRYQFFTSTPALLAFPFAVSSLVSQSLISSSPLFPLVHVRLRTLFLAAGFPPSSELFSILNLKLSQTILNFLYVLPFTLSCLLLAKASIIRVLHHRKISSLAGLFKPLVITQLCSSLVILSANATCFCLVVLFFNCFDVLGFSSPGSLLLVSAIGAIIYSIVLANAYIICNLGVILSAMEKGCGGFISILKACILIRGNTATALSLAVPINMALAAVESLFQYRVVRAYNQATAPDSSIVFEGLLIAYLYALILVLDTIAASLFLKSCKTDPYLIETEERDKKSLPKAKVLELIA